MVEINESYITREESLKWDTSKEIIDNDVAKISFQNTLNQLEIESPNQDTKTLFDSIISWTYRFDNQWKNEKREIQNKIKNYVKDLSNKNHVLDAYINKASNFPQRIEEIIISTYSLDEIWEYELQAYFNENSDIITVWKNIIWLNWDGNNIDDNTDISTSCPWRFFTEVQFITSFNEKNQKRIDWNTEIIKNIDLYTFTKQNLEIKKERWILYINNISIKGWSALWNILINTIKEKTPIYIVNISELQKLLQNIYKDNDRNTLYEKLYDTSKESNENYCFHDTWLNFFTEDKLEDTNTILENFKRNTWNSNDIEFLKEKNDDLERIMGILPINEDDKPDTQYEKKKLIYLLNHWLFRWFQLAINSLSQSGVNCVQSSPYLSKNNKKNGVQLSSYDALVKHLERYQAEKDENFYKAIDDINKIDIDFSNNSFNKKTRPHLNNPQKRKNIMNVVNLAKSYFIQKIKDGQTPNRNIETYKNQLAYMLSTLEWEAWYNYNAKNGIYRWYGQINKWYTKLRTIFAQWSGLNFWVKDKYGEETNWKNIQITETSFQEEQFSTFAFVYWMVYGHLSNSGCLDDYINDQNVNNPDFQRARRIEAWSNDPKYTETAKMWKKVIDESSNI